MVASSSQDAEPDLTAVVVNYNGWEDLVRLISGLGEETAIRDGRCEVILVDNASPDPMPEGFLPLREGVRLIARRENGGFAAGVNTGRAAARGRWLLVLNPDVVAEPGVIDRIVEKLADLEKRPEGPPGVVGFGLRNEDGSPQPSVGVFPNLARAAIEQLIPRGRRKYQADWRTRPGLVAWVTGACMLVNRGMLDEVGGMDEDFFLYYEEVALCKSAKDHGWTVEYDPSIWVYHLRPLQNRAISPKMRVITRHSKLLYFRKHLPSYQFGILRRVVAIEATLRGTWARISGLSEESGAWKAVSRIAREMRAGSGPKGREVLLLAEAAVAPGSA